MTTPGFNTAQVALTLPDEKRCEYWDGLTGLNVTVPASSIRCPETLNKILKPIHIVQIVIFLLFLFFGIVIGLAISLAVVDMQSATPNGSPGLDISLITFSAVSAVMLLALAFSSARIQTSIYKIFPEFFRP